MQTEGQSKAMMFAIIVFLLFGGYFVYAMHLTGAPAAAPPVQAKTTNTVKNNGNIDSVGENKQNNGVVSASDVETTDMR